jgi:SAM-dependent methyltransferase
MADNGLTSQVGARHVLDVGCGTGTLALMLAARGLQVTALGPARASLDVAQTKPGAQLVRWIHGDVGSLPVLQADLATVTANLAQAIAEPVAWELALDGIHNSLRPGGTLVFESRDPGARAWQRWTKAATWQRTDVAGVGSVASWVEVTGVSGPLVSFRWTWTFARDGLSLTSDSTLRFRDPEELEVDLLEHGFVVDVVLDAPDRPGKELMFQARREP